MAGRLQDKVCLITGAGSGMGKAMAEIFTREGAKLVQWVKERSTTPPPLRIDGHEVVLMDKPTPATNLR